MNRQQTTVNGSLLRARARWKWLRFVRHTCVLGILVCALLVAIGAAVLHGWISVQSRVLTLVGTIGAAALAAETIIVLRLAGRVPRRRWLAAEVERMDRRFQDRLNTLLFLETLRRESRARAFAGRIAEQARRLLKIRAVRLPFSPTTSLSWCVAFMAVLGGTLWLGGRYSPWEHLRSVDQRQATASRLIPPVAPPAAIAPEQNQAWGEVRITDPGGDLRVTKVDVVPLSIEAAANHDLKRVAWYSSINGNPEQPHALAAPKEPRYAVYQPTVYLDELQLSDWDVLTYYARAETDAPRAFASEVYFIEVRPFREDILKTPGGEGGRAYQTINEISSLIGRQQQVIRQTYQYGQLPTGSDPARTQTRKKLSGEEQDLAASAQHLYAQMAATMENQPIGVALDNLAKAEGSLRRAVVLLDADTIPEAEDNERAALSALVATRKMFQKAVSDHPDDFAQPRDSQADPVADSAKKLNEMAEFRDETKSAAEFVQKMTDRQKEVEQETETTPPREPSHLADREQTLARDLKEFSSEHPRPFKGAEPQSEQARQSLQRAGESLQEKGAQAFGAVREATQQLEKLSSAMRSQAQGKQLAQSYRLKQMIEDQIRLLDKLAQSPNPATSEQAAQAAQAAKQVFAQLKRSVNEASAGAGMGQPLSEAVSKTDQSGLNDTLEHLQQAGDDQERRKQAAEARDSLQQISRAFDASQPKALQAARQTDSLKADPKSGFAQGLSQLDNLLRQLQQERKLPVPEQDKQAREALDNLQAGLTGQLGQSDRGRDLLNQLQQMLDSRQGLNPDEIKRLLEQLERFSIEARPKLAGGPSAEEVLNLDPSRLPPAYRERIERYFQKLSEK